MSLTINTNPAAVIASFNLNKNNASLQKSLARLSSGYRITKPSDDAGGLAVSMKLNGAINRLQGTTSNIQNAVSFLEVQDGVLQASGDIINRMAELKSLSQDVLKSSSDVDNYNAEFKDLQQQLYQISKETFNGVSLFATTTTRTGSTDVEFGGGSGVDHTVSIYTTERGSAGTVVSVHKGALLSAVTFTSASDTSAATWAKGLTSTGTKQSLASETEASSITLDKLSVSFFTAALENIATLRAQNGGTSSRLNFAMEHSTRSIANLEAANGRIMDVDIAAESTRLARANILVQASASMLAQANVAPNAALMLLG
tara:strand:+ start:204 stop:1148 length:945 start_codon:yes stop_codon:yes gene_type:complete